jgi:hypothetical protein
MSEEPIAARTPASRRWKWIIRGVVWTFVILVISGLGSYTVLVETPVHFVLGWLFHAVKALPPLLGNWRPLVAPLGCLVLATWLIHRFVRWSQVAKGKPPSWRVGHTISAVSLLMLGCGAAIALSGVLHQTVWLMSDPWTENRGKRMEQTLAVSNARQLVMGLFEYYEKHGRYPNSLWELEVESASLARLISVPVGYSRVNEPFILLHPGGTRAVNAGEPLIVSPVIRNSEKIAVGYGDGSVTSLRAKDLDRVIKGESRLQIQQQPSR